MKIQLKSKFFNLMSAALFFAFFATSFAQQDPDNFESRIRFGGGLALGIGSGFTNITIAPSAIYDFNPYFSAGVGFQGSYLKQRNFYESIIFGPSLLAFVNPIQEIQLSAELEQLRVSTTYDNPNLDTHNFWNTALFLGAGYRTENVTIGMRYNVLHDDDENIYGSAFMPFVRVYF